MILIQTAVLMNMNGTGSYNYPEIEFLEDGRIMMNTERYLDYTGSDGSTSSRYGWPSQGKFLLKTEIYYTRR